MYSVSITGCYIEQKFPSGGWTSIEVCKVLIFANRLCVHHQHSSWSFRHSNHRETQD